MKIVGKLVKTSITFIKNNHKIKIRTMEKDEKKKELKKNEKKSCDSKRWNEKECKEE
jgi:hypothetical protein